MTTWSDETPHLSLDCLGMKCPRPIIELARSIDQIPVDGLIEVLADDPAAAFDLAAWCRMRDQQLVSAEGSRFLVRRLV